MFDHLNELGTDYVTPHRYQVILQVSFASGLADLTELYFADRRSNPATKMFTLSPSEPFVLSDVTANQPLSSFNGTIFRGHLERGGQPVTKLDNIKVKVELIPESPIAMEESLRFAIREGGKTVGSGVVTKIVE